MLSLIQYCLVCKKTVFLQIYFSFFIVIKNTKKERLLTIKMKKETTIY
jgi:hypothetical protein